MTGDQPPPAAGGSATEPPDLVTFGETMLRLSTPPGERLETTTSLAVHVGGAESNVAAAASRLGLETAWLSKLPDSAPARRILATLRQHGVDPRVARGEGRVGTYYREPGGKPRGTTVHYDRDGAAVRTATPDDLDVDAVEEAAAFYTSGITPALSAQVASTTRTLLERARDAGTLTAFDLNYRSKLWSPEAARTEVRDLLGLVDVLVVAERDANRVLDRTGEPGDVAAGLADEYGHETVVLTRSEDGALAYHDGSVTERAGVPTDAHDAVGSGDAFTGAFLAKRLQGGSVPEALEWATAAASLTMTIDGDVAVLTPAEVESVLDGEGEGIER